MRGRVESSGSSDSVGARYDPAELRKCVAAILERVGLAHEDADLAADVLVAADLRGVETHGVSNMLRRYLDWIGRGHVKARATMRVIREAPAVATLDGDGGLGVVAVPKAMELAIQKARAVGVGMVTVGNSRHLGMAAYHAMLALPFDMIGICVTAVGPIVVPTFGRDPRLGTNPLAFAAPTQSEPPFVFDAATSAIAANRITTWHRLGLPVPPGVIADEQGRPIVSESPAPDGYADARLLPLGSTREAGSHKGYSLAVIVEILSSVLAGAPYLLQLGRDHANHWVCAIDVAAFTDPAAFKSEMDSLLQDLKATPTAPGHDRVLVAGQLEWEHHMERTASGIPLHPEVEGWLGNTCRRLGLDPPVRMDYEPDQRQQGGAQSDGTTRSCTG